MTCTPPSRPPGIVTLRIKLPLSSKRRIVPPSSASKILRSAMNTGSSNVNQMVPPSRLSSGSEESLSSEMIRTLSFVAVRSVSPPVGLAPSKTIASLGEERPSPSRCAEIVTPSNCVDTTSPALRPLKSRVIAPSTSGSGSGAASPLMFRLSKTSCSPVLEMSLTIRKLAIPTPSGTSQDKVVSLLSIR